MSGKTSWLAGQFLRTLQGYNSPAFSETWATLFTTAPTSDTTSGVGSAVEWSPAVPRVQVNSVLSQGVIEPYWYPIDAPTDAGNQIYNVGAVKWPAITGLSSAATVKAVGVYSASTGGILLYWADLGQSRVVDNGDEMQFPSGSLRIQEQ